MFGILFRYYIRPQTPYGYAILIFTECSASQTQSVIALFSYISIYIIILHAETW